MTIRKSILGVILLLAVQACAPPGTATLDPNSINTAIAQTLAAASQTAGPGIPVTGDDSPTPSQTATPVLPTATRTPSPIASSTPLPLFTSTSTAPRVSVSVPTNCRLGPGVVYGRVGGLQPGEVADVVGRHATRDYWIINNPDRSGQTCWLWGEYATLTGNTGALPVLTPPPTPTPSPVFTITYKGLESCSGWWADLELNNTGGITFESISIRMTDEDTDVVASLYSDVFDNINGCSRALTRQRLNPDGIWIVSGPVFRYDIRGHEIRATITLCSRDGQSGTCATESLRFEP